MRKIGNADETGDKPLTWPATAALRGGLWQDEKAAWPVADDMRR
ncbi:MAG: hypothetical protein U0792_18645 [Gemmataceae bacterium]